MTDYLVTYWSHDDGMHVARAIESTDRRKAAEFYALNEEPLRQVARLKDGALFQGDRSGLCYYVTEVRTAGEVRRR